MGQEEEGETSLEEGEVEGDVEEEEEEGVVHTL